MDERGAHLRFHACRDLRFFDRPLYRYCSFFVIFHVSQVDASWQEQIRRKQIEADHSRNVMEQEIATVQAALRREAEAEIAELEKAKTKRIETMMDNKQFVDARLADRCSEQQEKHRIQEQIRNGEESYKKRIQEKKKHLI